MKMERIKCKPLERAKDIHISRSYIIGCTGPKAVILDRQLNLIHTVDGLEYVYSAQVSPDETKLLLISNGNKFYVVDMQTFEKTRITVRAPYNYNLEGLGCWSFDGKSIWIPVNRSKGYINSTLRRYCVEDFSQFEDYLHDKYCIGCLLKLEKTRTYFLIGYNRQEDNRYYFIYFDGVTFRELPLEMSVDLIASKAAVNTEKGVVTVCSLSGCQRFTLEGEKIKTIAHPEPKPGTIHTADVFKHLCDSDTEKQNKMEAIFAALEPKEVSTPDVIEKYAVSNCGNYIYLASKSGFYLLDATTGDILATVLEKYGVQNFEELVSGVIALSTWSGVKIYSFGN